MPANREAPNGIFHTFHYGADTALWNTQLANGEPSVPATGQALRVRLDGCAKPAPNGPPPVPLITF